MHRHPKKPLKEAYADTDLGAPFESENAVSEVKRSELERQRRDNGEAMQPADNPVKDTKPYRNLK